MARLTWKQGMSADEVALYVEDQVWDAEDERIHEAARQARAEREGRREREKEREDRGCKGVGA